MVGLVGNAQELEAKSDLYESQHNFHTIEPGTGLALHLLQQRREHRQDRERQGEGDGEGQHSDHRGPELALRGLDQHRTYNRAGAGERHQHKGQSHKEYAAESFAAGFRVTLVGKAGRQLDLEGTEEGGSENHKHDEEYEVRQPVCR